MATIDQSTSNEVAVQPNASEKKAISRRKLLELLIGGINLCVLGGIIGPVIGLIVSPARRNKTKDDWIPVMTESELPIGQMRSVNYELVLQDGYTVAKRRYSVYLMRQANGDVVALDPTCPHLGCRVAYKATKQRFICPCHGGVFDAQGKLLSGPPPRGLTKLPARVAEGKVWIRRNGDNAA